MPQNVRLATIHDAAELLSMYAPAVTDTPINFEYVAPTLAEYEARMETIMERYPWLVCEQDGRVAGFCFAGPHRSRPGYSWSVELGIYVHPAFRRKRVARSLYDRLLEMLQAQGFHRAFASITLPNEASVALHLSMGFKAIGVFEAAGYKLGKWHDAGWYQRTIGKDLPSAPAPPRTPDEMIRAGLWST